MQQPYLVFDEWQSPQPRTDDDRDLADHDLNYFLRFLSSSRGQRYELIERPDEMVRQIAAPDYLIQNSSSGRLIAIERTQLMLEEFQASTARLIKGGADFIFNEVTSLDSWQLAVLLRDAIQRKIARGQLHNVDADERILLIRNRLNGASLRTFLDTPLDLNQLDKGPVDDIYVIARSRLIKLW